MPAALSVPAQFDRATPGETPSDVGLHARIAALDARIEMLVADVQAFAGEMRVTAMAELLTTLVERQTLMHQEMMTMHGRMMGHARDQMMPRALRELDGEPERMCAPEEW